MIKARKRADLSIAMGLSEEAESKKMEPRPSSAPTTRGECNKVRRRILSAEPHQQQRQQHQEQQELSLRPQSCLANISTTT